MHNATKFLSVFIMLNICISDLGAETGSFSPDAVFVYRDMVGGPYFDEWYLDGDRVKGINLRLHRQGKSGSLEMPVTITCESRTLTVSGDGLVFEHIAISATEAQNYLTADITAAVIDKACVYHTTEGL